MKAQELRIGNWGREITPSTNAVVKVEQRHFESIENGEIDLFPIDLTEEWLLKFGFEKDNHVFRLGIIAIFIQKEFGHFEVNILHTDMDNKICKHVHQLQNLYHSLTGEELTIK